MLKYNVTVPVRSFGPEDPIIAHLQVVKLPAGHAVHHVDLIVNAEMQIRANGILKKSREEIMRHRDLPPHAGWFW
jgi:hypothetical protein